MIYHRRALQRRLNELREVLGNVSVTKLASRLNRPGKDRIAAMWELIVLHGLSKCGQLQHEECLESGRRPDILFQQSALRLTADVTAASDDGLNEANPYRELGILIEAAKTKLGLPAGGFELNIRAQHRFTNRGTRTVLRLPPREKLQEFVHRVIVPQIRARLADQAFPLHIPVDDDEVGLDLVIDPTKSPYGAESFPAYYLPTIKDQNPLYNALKAKAVQLRGAGGVTGIIVGDGSCVTLSDRSGARGEVSTKQIVEEFFRQYTSIDFVLLLSVRGLQRSRSPHEASTLRNHAESFYRPGFNTRSDVTSLFRAVIEQFPQPAMTPANGALRACEKGYDLGHHGGYQVAKKQTIRLSLREFTEIFAGLRSLQDNGAKYVEAGRKIPDQENKVQAIVARHLRDGRLPSSIEIIKTDENDNDDWVEIRFGEIDPAIAPLR